MNREYNPKYPDIKTLKQKAKQRIPKFAFDYLEEGCGDEIGLRANRQAIEAVQLRAQYLKPHQQSQLKVKLFGKTYSAPFGIAPIGLQGLMWPKAPEILARAAAEHNIPYILSTVSSASLETIAEVSEGSAWFQLYNPTDKTIRNDLLNRIKAAAYPVLVVTVDVPTFGYRPRDIKNGLSMPPKMSVSNLLQMLAKPQWLMASALAGKPEMATLKPYMPKDLPTDHLAEFMNKTVMGTVDFESLKVLRDQWQGPLVIKGLTNAVDLEQAIALGADGVIVSNHGARQLDVGEPPVKPLKHLSATYGNQIKIMMDSGLQSGANIACALACGAEFTFLGRPFVYGVAALGHAGGKHTITILKTQLQQVIEQLRCPDIADLPLYIVNDDG